MQNKPTVRRLAGALSVCLALMFGVLRGNASAQSAAPEIWGVTYLNEIWRRQNNAWVKLPGSNIRQVSVASDGSAWAIGNNDDIFRWTGSAWTTVPGKLKQISCASDQLIWGTNAANEVWKWIGDQWQKQTGTMKQVSVAVDGAVWALDPTGNVFSWNGSAWVAKPGNLAQLSLGSASLAWGVDANNNVYRWSGNAWDKQPGALTHVSVSNDGNTWGTNGNSIFRWTGSTWTSVEGSLRQVSVAAAQAVVSETFAKMCWKQTYTRGAGTVPTDCPAGQDKDAGLCYDKCKPGYVGVGPVCWSSCPAGFRDDGAFCAKPEAYGRGAGYAIWSEDKCRAENNGSCEKNGAMWYPTCRAGFSPAGCCICSPNCPASMTDIGVSCAKTSYGRGVGKVPGCAGGTVNDAGLCYPSCARDYDGVGPVCWGKCPADYPFACGAGCARSQSACAAAVSQMVTDTVSVAVNIALLVVGAPGVGQAAKTAAQQGATAAGKVAARGGFTSLGKALQPAMKAYARDFAKTFIKTYAKNMVTDKRNLFSNVYKVTKFAGLTGANQAAKEFGSLKTEGQFDYSLLAVADPTGIASMVYAFAQYGSCTVEDLAPSAMSFDFGTGALDGSQVRTIEITAQNKTTVTEITTSALSGCEVIPTASCIGKTLQPGEKCTIEVRAKANAKLLGEVRVYTSVYDAVPMSFEVTGNSGAGTQCASADADEAVNISSIAGVWAWNNDQNQKVVIDSKGIVSSYLGQGTVTVADPIKRTFNITLGNTKATATLSVEHDRMTVVQGGKTMPATKRPWDSRCNPGETFSAGLCYDVPVDYEVTTPGFIGKPCREDWRDDGVQCYPPWAGKMVSYQADPDGTYTMRHPILVTDCSQYAQTKKQTCPVNFKNTGGPAGCTCEAQPYSKEVKSLIGKLPK